MRGFYLIWSLEHDAWWAPGEVGYTRVLAEAGFYTEAEARRIEERGNIVHFNECPIPVQCLLGSLPSWSLEMRRRGVW